MSSGYTEQPLTFSCKGETLIAITGIPAGAAPGVGVVIVVGGPQYRVGSHRQFVLLARRIAAAGVPVLRFDYRGMGDSAGAMRDFETVAPDIRAAIDTLVGIQPGVQDVVLWGLCDAASAALMYAPSDPRVSGLVLVNPWVRTDAGIARVYVTSYYLERLASREFWARLLGGKLDVGARLREFLGNVRAAFGRPASARAVEPRAAAPAAVPAGDIRPLPDRMLDAMHRFRGRLLLVLSGRDLTADEFRQCVARDRRWRKALGARAIERRELPDADHTFSTAAWREALETWTCNWLTGR
jgi:exosortase A-associated hydrolase 1